MKNGRLKAFTIMEVIIAMLLSAILITITYTAYGIITRSFAGFTQKNRELGDLLRLDQLLRHDFSRGDRIYWQENGLTVTTEKDTVSYTFNKDNIIRTRGITDTFKVGPLQVETNFENQAIQGLAGPDQPILDELILPVVYHGEKITLHYQKTYSSANLFQTDQHGQH